MRTLTKILMINYFNDKKIIYFLMRTSIINFLIWNTLMVQYYFYNFISVLVLYILFIFIIAYFLFFKNKRSDIEYFLFFLSLITWFVVSFIFLYTEYITSSILFFLLFLIIYTLIKQSFFKYRYYLLTVFIFLIFTHGVTPFLLPFNDCYSRIKWIKYSCESEGIKSYTFGNYKCLGERTNCRVFYDDNTESNQCEKIDTYWEDNKKIREEMEDGE